MENPTYIVLQRQTLCFISYKNPKLKVEQWWIGARERKKRAFFVPCILPEGIFFKICVLFQYIVYQINFQNIHTFIYQKTLPLHFCCLLLKWSKAFITYLFLFITHSFFNQIKEHPLKEHRCKFEIGKITYLKS